MSRRCRPQLLVGLAVVFLLPVSARAGQESVAVMPMRAKGVPKATVEILDELLVQSVSSYSPHKIVGIADINAMLGHERLKQSLTCDSVACAADIGGALGTRFILSASVAKLGSNVIVSLSLIDNQKQEVTARAKAKVRNDEDLYDAAIETAAAELFGVPVRPGTAAELQGGAAAPAGPAPAPSTSTAAVAPAPAATTASAAQSAGEPSPLRFGGVDEYADSSSHSSGYLLGSAVTIDRPLTLRAFGAVFKAPAGGFWMALYTDSGDRPGQLVVQTASTQVPGGRIEVPAPAQRIAAGRYWLMVACEAGDTDFGQHPTTTATIRYITHDYGAAAPRSWPTSDSVYEGKAHSVYVVGVP